MSRSHNFLLGKECHRRRGIPASRLPSPQASLEWSTKDLKSYHRVSLKRSSNLLDQSRSSISTQELSSITIRSSLVLSNNFLASTDTCCHLLYIFLNSIHQYSHKMVIKKRCLAWDWTNTRDIPQQMDLVNFTGPLSSVSNWNTWYPKEYSPSPFTSPALFIFFKKKERKKLTPSQGKRTRPLPPNGPPASPTLRLRLEQHLDLRPANHPLFQRA